MAQNETSKQKEERLSDKLYHDYYYAFIDELSKMDSVTGFVRDDRFFGHDDDLHIQYKYRFKNGKTFLMSKDGYRAYEFLIEFDKKDTSYGIYYGCRAYICEGHQELENQILVEEWNNLRGETCKILNNTFPNKDFSKRFRPTNNAENRTFWPFWITLGPEEDIVVVAARATAIIASVYERYFAMNPKYYHPVPLHGKRSMAEETAFSKDRYQEILLTIRKTYGREKEAAYKRFIRALWEQEYITPSKIYEKAWRLRASGETKQKELLITGLASLISVFCAKYQIMKDNGKGNAKTIPWEYFNTVFLTKNEEPITFFRQSYSSTKDNKESEEASAIKLTYLGL